MIRIRASDPPASGTKILETGIASDLSLRTPLGVRVVSALVEAGCVDEAGRAELEVCLEEAITNAIVHGNGEDPRRFVAVAVFTDGDEWRVHVSDEGDGFAAEAIADPDDPGFPWLEHGRGIHMIRHVAALEYFHGGRTAVISGVRDAAAARPRVRTVASGEPELRPDGVRVARLSPESAGTGVPAQVEAIVAWLEEDPPPLLVLDLSDVPRLPSTGIGALVRLTKACLRVGSRFALVGVSPGLREMLAMMQLDRVIAIRDGVEEAAEEVR